MDKATFDRGLEIRKAVLGKEFVENAFKTADDFNMPMQELATEYCWGWCWGREGLPLKTRSLINLAMISALNRPHELKVHVKGALSCPPIALSSLRRPCRKRTVSTRVGRLGGSPPIEPRDAVRR